MWGYFIALCTKVDWYNYLLIFLFNSFLKILVDDERSKKLEQIESGYSFSSKLLASWLNRVFSWKKSKYPVLPTPMNFYNKKLYLFSYDIPVLRWRVKNTHAPAYIHTHMHTRFSPFLSVQNPSFYCASHFMFKIGSEILSPKQLNVNVSNEKLAKGNIEQSKNYISTKLVFLLKYFKYGTFD